MIHIFLGWLVLGIYSSVQAQVQDTSQSRYIFKFGGSRPSFPIGIRSQLKPEPAEIRWAPNTQGRTFLGLAHDWWGLSVSWANSMEPVEVERKGATRATDYQFRFHFPTWSAEVYFQDYRGYYLENEKTINPGFVENSSHRKLEDMRAIHGGFSLTRIHSPGQFSFAASHDQSAIQKSSGGSWLTGLSLSFRQISNDASLVPTELQAAYGKFTGVRKIQNLSLSVNGGGGYTLVPAGGPIFISASIMLGLGPRFVSYETQTDTGKDESWQTQTLIKIGAGYNGERFLFGVQIFQDTTNIKLLDTEINQIADESQIFIGGRF